MVKGIQSDMVLHRGEGRDGPGHKLASEASLDKHVLAICTSFFTAAMDVLRQER